LKRGIGEISHSFLALSPLAFFQHIFFIIAGKILPHAEIKSFFFLLFLLGRFPNFSAQAKEKKGSKTNSKMDERLEGWRGGGFI